MVDKIFKVFILLSFLSLPSYRIAFSDSSTTCYESGSYINCDTHDRNRGIQVIQAPYEPDASDYGAALLNGISNGLEQRRQNELQSLQEVALLQQAIAAKEQQEYFAQQREMQTREWARKESDRFEVEYLKRHQDVIQYSEDYYKISDLVGKGVDPEEAYQIIMVRGKGKHIQV